MIMEKYLKTRKIFKKEIGITLIALVITIIVLLILAGVTISALSGDNGILTNATKAKEQTEISNEKDQIGVASASSIADNKGGELTKDAMENNLIVKQGNDATVTDEGEYLRVRFNETQREYLVNKESGEIEEKGIIESPIIPENLKIGSEVIYDPNGTYNWSAGYSSAIKKQTEDDILLDSSKTDYNIEKWKIFDIDKQSGDVLLVPAEPTVGTIYLGQAQGYNNAVYLLNKACENLYGDFDRGINARSITIDDIEKKMTQEALNGSDGAYKFNNGTMYGTKKENAYTGSLKYPIIYEREKQSVIGGYENSSGFGRSEQGELIGRTEGSAEGGNLNKTTSIQPYQTYWYKDTNFMKTAFIDIQNGKVNNYYDLIMPKGQETRYWVASRSVNPNKDYCTFNVRYVGFGSVSGCAMTDTRGYTSYENFPLFPVVTLNFQLIELNDSNEFEVK